MENMEYVHFTFEGRAYIFLKIFNQAKGRIKGTQKKQKQKKKQNKLVEIQQSITIAKIDFHNTEHHMKRGCTSGFFFLIQPHTISKKHIWNTETRKVESKIFYFGKNKPGKYKCSNSWWL